MTAIRHHEDATGNALMRAILANPDADLLRLVYADWLEADAPEAERDAVRAEFIRVQCEMATREPAAVGAVRNGRYKRADAEALDWDLVRLHDREMQLLWAKHRAWDSANWEIWCYAEAREDDGTPCCRGGLGGMTVTPHGSIGLGEDSNSCVVPFSYTEAGMPADSFGRQVRQWFDGGFVSKMQCPLAWWTGGECQTCLLWSVDTHIPREQQHAHCPDCKGTGRTPGHGAEVVARHPVTKVVTDRSPFHVSGGGETWSFFGVGHPSMWDSYDPVDVRQPYLPTEVFRRLPPDSIRPHSGTATFFTREAAVEALSRALVDMARDGAGLPPISREVTP